MGMNENESYLDSLLRAVMEPKVEELVVEEIPVMEEPMIEEVPTIAEEPSDIFEMPEIKEIPDVFEVPEMEVIPDVLEVSEIEEIPDVFEVPEIEEIPDVLEVPNIEEIDETFIEEGQAEEVLTGEFSIGEVQIEEEPVNEFMQMPEFVMDEETAKEVEAMLNFDFGVSSIPEYTETPEKEIDQPIIEEVAEENEQPIIEEVVEEYETSMREEFPDEFAEPQIEEMPDEIMMEDVTDVPDGIPSELLSGSIEYVADESTYDDEPLISDETTLDDETLIGDEATISDETEINDEFLDLDIENLLGLESIETDDSELEDNEVSFEDEFNRDVEVITPMVDDNSIVGTPSLEDAQEMSQEDIEKLLTESSQVETVSSEDDLFALLSGGTEEVASADDLLALLGGADDETALYTDLSVEETTEDNKEEKPKKKKKGKKKEAVSTEGESVKKQGIFQKFITFLTETDEEDEDKKVSGQGEMEMSEAQMADLFSNVSEENQEIMDELDKEDKKKKKVKRKKKGKKDEAVAVDAEEEEVRAKPAGKKKKEKKAKKEKRVSVDDLDTSGKKLSKKKVIITFVLIITVMIAILLVNYLYAGAQVLKKARNAYYNQDYSECYQILYGKELNESDKIIYKRSELMLKMSRSIEAYEGFIEADMPIQALDSLIQGIGRFESLRVEATLYELEQEAERIYGEIVGYLGGFGVSEEKAMDIYNSESDEEYTNQLIDAVENGTPIVEEEAVPEKEYLYEALPVEEEIN